MSLLEVEGLRVRLPTSRGLTTIVDVYRAGANIMVAGSAIFSTPVPGDAYRELVSLAAGHSRV